MKYRRQEQKTVDNINKFIDKIEKRKEKEYKKINKIEEFIETLADQKFKQSLRISTINERVRKRCKHTGERRYWRNNRDDASFERYCACIDCDEVLWDDCK